MHLTAEQIAFFKENGYLLLPKALDTELCAQARARMWSSLPPDSDLKRDDPTTHIGPFSEKDTQIAAQNLRQGYRWQLREMGTEPLMINLVYSERMMAIAEQLLGAGTLRRPIIGGVPMGSKGFAWPNGPVDPANNVEGIRGIYNTLPYGNRPKEPDHPHTDGHPFHLGLVGLINDVPPGGGGFRIWPKSHKRLYPLFRMQYDQARIPFYEHMPSHKGILYPIGYAEEMAQICQDTEPVDCWGKAGDVVLWHHRMAHMAGHNHSSVIREAILGDFSKLDLDKTRMDPPQPDMWRDWSESVRLSDGVYSQNFAQTQRLGLK
ncbi:MAG: phytanoyl-CoA dioxygenase family protein [Chloroflexota bacterium]